MLLDWIIPEKDPKEKECEGKKICYQRGQFIAHLDIGLVKSKSICENFVSKVTSR